MRGKGSRMRVYGEGLDGADRAFYASVEQRPDGRWGYYLPFYERPGKRVRYKGVYDRQRDAEAAARAKLKELSQGFRQETANVTVEEYLTAWLAGHTKRGGEPLSPTTRSLYATLLRKHVLPAIGGMRLRDVKPQTLAKLYEAVGNGSAYNTAAMLGSAFTVAVEDKIIPENPARSRRSGKPIKRRKELKLWTIPEAKAFLAAVRDRGDTLGALFFAMTTTGLRRGEALALRWSDLDASERRLLVSKQLVLADNRVIERDATKTGKQRVVYLDSATVGVLMTHRKRQVAERLRAAEGYGSGDFIFANPIGEPLHPDAVTRAWDRACRAAGVPDIRLHDARHMAAVFGLAAGVSLKLVQERLGHADLSMTSETYLAYIPDELQARAAEAIGDVLGN
jgi:integrase